MMKPLTSSAALSFWQKSLHSVNCHALGRLFEQHFNWSCCSHFTLHQLLRDHSFHSITEL